MGKENVGVIHKKGLGYNPVNFQEGINNPGFTQITLPSIHGEEENGSVYHHLQIHDWNKKFSCFHVSMVGLV